jgi:hypothetical protein
VGKKEKSSFHNVVVLAFCGTILLVIVGAGDMMQYSIILEMLVQALVFATLIGLNTLNFGIEKTFNMCLKANKNLLNFIFCT